MHVVLYPRTAVTPYCGMPEPDQNRQADRQGVLKRAKLIFQGSVVDCLVLNVSESGFRVQLSAVVPMPERIAVQFSGGATFSAVQRWARGTEVGFGIDGPAQLGTEERAQASELHDSFRARGFDEPLRRLRDLRCFDDPELARLAQEAEAAVQRLEAALGLLAHGRR